MNLKNAVRILAAVLLVLFAFPASRAHAAYSGGSGTSGDPYQIATCADFEGIGAHASADFILENDIDCRADGNAMSSATFFTGDFNGGGHKITIAIAATAPSSSWSIWETLAGTMENVWIAGTITDTYGTDNLGGLVYSLVSGSISNVKNTLAITGTTGDSIGGFAVYLDGGQIQNSYFNGTIGGTATYASGFAYEIDAGIIANSYSSGSVTAQAYASGIVGNMTSEDGITAVQNDFVTGAISSLTPGAIIGNATIGSSSNNYYDVTTTGLSGCYHGSTEFGCTAVNSGNSAPNYFKGNSTNAPFTAPWNFSTVWQTVAGNYPILRSILVPASPAPTLLVPASSASYVDTAFSVSFILPAAPLSGNATLTFTPTTGSANVIALEGLSAGTTTFALPLSDVSGATPVVSETSNSIPDGTYTVTISYQDASGDTPASTGSTGVVIAGVPAPAVVAAPHRSAAVIMIQPTSADGSGPLDFTIDSGKTIATSPSLSLEFNADPKTVTGYAVSLDPTFAGGGILPYASTGAFALPDKPGTYTVYVEYFSPTGNRSATLSHMVTYASDSAPILSAGAGTNPKKMFARDLKLGTQGPDVAALQDLLVKDGELAMPPGAMYGYFGKATQQALEAFQAKYAIVALGAPGSGTFGPKTRAEARSLSSKIN